MKIILFMLVFSCASTNTKKHDDTWDDRPEEKSFFSSLGDGLSKAGKFILQSMSTMQSNSSNKVKVKCTSNEINDTVYNECSEQ